MAAALKTTIEGTTGLKVRIVRPTEPDSPGIVFVAVGIKTD
jgi:hypothetical protein